MLIAQGITEAKLATIGTTDLFKLSLSDESVYMVLNKGVNNEDNDNVDVVDLSDGLIESMSMDEVVIKVQGKLIISYS